MGLELHMILRMHNSELPIKRLKRKSIEQTNISNKPEGFWYSIDDAWISWCKKNDNLDWIGKFNYSVDISKLNILKLYSEAKIFEFTEMYNDGNGIFTTFVDWREVAKKYDGIEITVYFPHLAGDSRTNWLKGWDCASGCIWNMKNVKITKI